MDVFLPKGFEPGPGKRQMTCPVRVSSLSVKAGGIIYPVLRRWATGFAVSAQDVPVLEGVVDLFDGAEHLHQCLITRSEMAQGATGQRELVFTIKRASAVDYAAVLDMGGDDLAAALR